MKHGSLFSGIGGFDLAAEWMGWENVFHCEWNDFGKRVLSYYWPNAISYNDITKTNFTIHRGGIDILTGDSPANRTALPGNAGAKMTNATCGPKCLEQFGRFGHVGLWAKTFSALLIGTGDWYSMRCKLTWKLKGTKSNRLYFQLQASTLPTNGTEFGLWLSTPRAMETPRSEAFSKGRTMSPSEYAQKIMLPIPTAMDMLPPKTDKAREKEMTETRPGRTMPNLATQVMGLLKTPCAADAYSENLSKKEQKFGNSGTLAQEIQSGFVEKRWPGLLPTPTTQEPTSECKITENGRRLTTNGKDTHSLNLGRMASMGMLPTPTLQDARIGPNNIGGSQHRAERGSIALADIALGLLPTPTRSDFNARGDQPNWDGSDLVSTMHKATFQTGKTSQLNPRFVLEMMGFPPNWTELPFLNGETNQSRPPETQSVPK